ncbi:MAG: hypothetical protein L7R83_01160 [Candidatus Poseidonia sp.]|nr:hypothetical protein [Poseidonia sp.]
MSTTVWFLTSNAGKLEEAQHHFKQLNMEVKGLDLPENAIVEPQATDLETVARSKIAQAMHHLPSEGAMVMVEDAGLFVDALDGFPGVYSSHAFSTIGNHGLLRLLSHLVDDDPVRIKNLRSASFEAVAALWDGEKVLIGKGSCKGAIATEVQGEAGFGFDPVFIPADLDDSGAPLSPGTLGSISTHGQTFGVVGPYTKHQFSHRRRALEELLRQLPLYEPGE